jgi:hypothetical protein
LSDILQIIKFNATNPFSNSSQFKDQKMKSVKSFIYMSLLVVLMISGSIGFQGCKPNDCEEEKETNECDTCIMVLKPNIYIYPQEKTQLFVNLNFPKGGKVVTSIPEYGAGWSVSVDINGWINDSYNYLFYESSQPDVWQITEGWIIKGENLKNFFMENMNSYGFAGREIEDFTDFWIPRFSDAEYYEIFPQSQQLVESVIQLDISKKPDNLLRLFYVVRQLNHQPETELPEPQIENQFKREGFFVTEWGVILK